MREANIPNDICADVSRMHRDLVDLLNDAGMELEECDNRGLRVKAFQEMWDALDRAESELGVAANICDRETGE